MLQNGDLVSGLSDSWIKIWSKYDWNLKKTLNGHRGAVNDLEVLANGELVSASDDYLIKIKIWKV